MWQANLNLNAAIKLRDETSIPPNIYSAAALLVRYLHSTYLGFFVNRNEFINRYDVQAAENSHNPDGNL